MFLLNHLLLRKQIKNTLNSLQLGIMPLRSRAMQMQTLKRQFRLWTALFILVPSLLIMAIYTVGQIKVAREQNLEMISQRVHFQERLIDYWMKERSDEVRKISHLEEFRTLNAQQMKRILVIMQQDNKNFDSLSYIDNDGIFRISTLHSGIKYPLASDKPYFEAAVAGKEYISDVVIGRNSGLPIINFSSPIFDHAGNFQGLILGSVGIDTLQMLLHDHWFGKTDLR